MKKLPLAKRLEFWKYQCAALTFSSAREVAEQLIKDRNQPLTYQLMTSLYVLYGRPFKQREQVRISKELVPPEYSEQHNILINLRDKNFAHVDSDGITNEDIPLNKMILGYRDGGFRASWQFFFPDDFKAEKITKLCNYLYKICHDKADKILIDALDGTQPSDITYEVDLGEGDRYLIKMREM